MSKQQLATRVVTVVPSAAISKGRGITHAWAQATDGTSSAGQAIFAIADENIAAGDQGRAIMGETAMAEAGAAINGSEPRLKTDAQGRFIPWTSGSIVAARLVPGQTAGAAGQFVEVYITSV
ncbi:hypothetical protein [Aulosira sp. FACHB-615]|uniref:hypothetical protein n=1 Tax=Aulosira sp. FACHB-615 TaxID=2692777 RepID=UPI0016877980|nr:hypothetical protein [Aulosira sp. FACHB-615]MBD2492472.1 hypothetical protein [Aulosira sp. FACHB-615]